VDHYAYWKNELPDGASLPFGAFGENLTVEGLLESDIYIGDLLEVGTARLRVTQPRMPCVKLAIRFGRSDMVKRFWKSGLSGIYFAVEQAGEVGTGDEIVMLEKDPLKVSVRDVVRLYKGESHDNDLFQRFMATSISGSWKEDIGEQWTA
jgi:MOSC domain-containing protein YiiM